MRCIKSVNIGLPKELEWRGKQVLTGIFKYPATTAVQVTLDGLKGDGQGDLVHHGGKDKAVYAYPFEHYSYWKEFLRTDNLRMGIFGENLTIEGLMDYEVCLGDYFQFGSAILMAIQPRMPCSKIGLPFNDPKMTQHFAKARRNGFYFRVIKEGTLQEGDPIQLVEKSPYAITIQEVVDCYAKPKENAVRIEQILNVPFLPQLLKSSFIQLLD
jgi:MOSC domain-containing protein YiiM